MQRIYIHDVRAHARLKFFIVLVLILLRGLLPYIYCKFMIKKEGNTHLQPLRSGLDRINNIEIKQEAMEEVAELKKFITQFNIKASFFINEGGVINNNKIEY